MQITIHNMQPKHYERVGTIYKQGIDSHHCTFESDVPTWEGVWREPSSLLSVCGLKWKRRGHRMDCLESNEFAILFWRRRWSQYLFGSTRNRTRDWRAIIIYLITESEQNGIWSLISGIFPENVASLRLHQKCGFRYVGYREKMGKTREGVFRDVLFMERRSLKVGV